MNLNDRKYAEFKVSDLFVVKYGVNLELNACTECERTDADKVNFVARTAENNGVSAYVNVISDVIPQKAGLISVAGGGSVLSTFLQKEPFYSGRDLYTLDSKDDISDEAKLFIITIIEKNKYKYSYGRQANKTLPDLLLKLPIDDEGNPDYKYMEDYVKSLHHKPLTTKNKSGKIPSLNVQGWREFKVGNLFKITGSTTTSLEDLEEIGAGESPYVTTAASDNGVAGFYSKCTEKGNIICIESACAAYATYQAEDFSASDHVEKCIPRFDMNIYHAMFVVSILNLDQYKYSYGRKCNQTRIRERIIKLPATSDGDPDWDFMEEYIKSLPYGDRLEG